MQNEKFIIPVITRRTGARRHHYQVRNPCDHWGICNKTTMIITTKIFQKKNKTQAWWYRYQVVQPLTHPFWNFLASLMKNILKIAITVTSSGSDRYGSVGIQWKRKTKVNFTSEMQLLDIVEISSYIIGRLITWPALPAIFRFQQHTTSSRCPCFLLNNIFFIKIS